MRILWDLFFTFAKLSFFTVGGGMGMIPIVYDKAIHQKGWMTEEEMLDCVALSQSLPGAMIINMATYIGKRQKGLPGSACASLGIIIPSFLMMITAMTILKGINENTYVVGAFEGAKAGAIGLVMVACYKLGKPILKGIFDWIVAIIAFSIVVFGQLSPFISVLFGLFVGFSIFIKRVIITKIEEKKKRKEGM